MTESLYPEKRSQFMRFNAQIRIGRSWTDYGAGQNTLEDIRPIYEAAKANHRRARIVQRDMTIVEKCILDSIEEPS